MSDLPLSGLDEANILVIGDVMLDRYISGTVTRISPEAPVPVLLQTDEYVALGGAGNVVANLASLGATVTLISVIGADNSAEEISNALDGLSDGKVKSVLVRDEDRPTTEKTRLVSGSQQIVRLDRENTNAVPSSIEDEIITAFNESIGDVDLLIVSDYAKGMLTDRVLRHCIGKAGSIPVIVDGKGNDFGKYKNATYITPNREEVTKVTGLKSLDTDKKCTQAAQKIITDSGIENVLLTRSEAGLSLICKNGKHVHFKGTKIERPDVSGAGDTVVAAFAAGLASGMSPEASAQLANLAGTLVVQKQGTSCLTRDELLNPAFHTDAADEMISQCLSWDDAARQVRDWQKQGLKVGFTNGCFDIVHYGHVNYLKEARARCDKLIVGLNHDKSVGILKGPTRPVNDELARAAVIGALASTDMVVLFGAEEAGADNTPCALLEQIRPDIFFKGGDYKLEQLPEAKVVLAYNGEVDIMNLYEGYSTTNIIAKSKTG